MKQLTKTFMLSGAGFGVCMAFVFSIMHGIIIGIISGFSAGILFATIITLFMYYQSKKFQLLKQEMSKKFAVVYDGGANHFKGESVGGWLFLTEKEIIFKSHKYNIQNHELIIPYHDIVGITKKNNLGLVPNGIAIQTKCGKTERFVVWGRDIWIQKIKEISGLK